MTGSLDSEMSCYSLALSKSPALGVGSSARQAERVRLPHKEEH